MLELCLLTASQDLILCAVNAGVDRIVIDLERAGKDQRQAGRGLRMTDHELGSIASIRTAYPKLHLMVRVNSPGNGSRSEIEAVIENGATTLMLPYFHTVREASDFLTAVGGRRKTCLLVETAAAISILPELAKLPGLDEIHFGLNDLQISFGNRTIFDVFLDGTLDRAISQCSTIPYGIGGLAPLNWKECPVSPELLVAENIRLKGARCLLGRAFASLYHQDTTGAAFTSAIRDLRTALTHWQHADEEKIVANRLAFINAIERFSNR